MNTLTGYKLNNRYRGPVESFKARAFSENLSKDLANLFNIYNSLEEKIREEKIKITSENLRELKLNLYYLSRQMQSK